jgi:3-dehydroquinate dehydratase II
MAQILVIHGPNLNLLGTRETEIYGSTTLADINAQLSFQASESGHSVQAMQSNAEHEIIDRIHAARNKEDFIIINPGAFTHTSVAIRDAISASEVPFIEVHLSNVHAREAFRHQSYFSDIAEAVICGFGADGYSHALSHAFRLLEKDA